MNAETILATLAVGGIAIGFVYAHWIDDARRRGRGDR